MYYYNVKLENLIDNLKLEIKYKNISINIVDYLPYLKKGYMTNGDEFLILFDLLTFSVGNGGNENIDVLKQYYFNFCLFKLSKEHDIDKTEIKKMVKINDERNILKCLELILFDKSFNLNQERKSIPNIYDILKICMYTLNSSDPLINIITKNDNMRLIYNIIRGNHNIVQSILSKGKVCPFIAYSIAKTKNNSINDYVKLICSERIWFIKQSLINKLDSDIIGIILDYIKEFTS